MREMFETMENPHKMENNEKICPRCKKSLTGLVCYNSVCDSFMYTFSETELEIKKEDIIEDTEIIKDKSEEISDDEYVKELKLRSQLPEELPMEPEKEDLWEKEAEEMFAGAKKEKIEEKSLPLLPERLQIAVNIINDKLRRKILAAAGGETAVRISGDYEKNWVEKNLPRIFNEVVKEIRIPQDQYEILKRVEVPQFAQSILDEFKQNWLEERKSLGLS